MTLLVGLFVLGACGRSEQMEVDPYATYRPAMKSEFQGDFSALDQAPRYYLTVALSPVGDVLTGTAEIEVTNYSPDPWRYLVFRLYPALPQYGGEMSIQSVSVDNQPTNFVYQAQNSAVRINLAGTLEPDKKVRVRLNYRLRIPQMSDASTAYALFGRSQHMISLPLFYPSLAVYQPDPALGSGTWWQDIGTARGDAAFNVTSLFVVTATLPSEQVPVVSGTLVESTVLESTALDSVSEDVAESSPESSAADSPVSLSGQTRYVWVSGPVREFILHMSPLFSSASAEAYGTRVVSYWLPGQEAAGRAALDYSISALRIYSDYFGRYPFREMSVAVAPISNRGMEYPQVNLLGIELYTRQQMNLEFLVAHEVAHQWWYLLVHNDPVNMPWLDEALAEYSVRIYYERLRGPQFATTRQRERWQTPVDLLVARNDDSPLDRSVGSFETGQQYETVVYAKGALFYDKLREVLGDRRFQRFLRDYLQDYRYQIVNTATWQAELEKLQVPELDILFRNWVGAPSPAILPTPQPSNVEEDSSEAGDGPENGPENGEVEEEVPDMV